MPREDLPRLARPPTLPHLSPRTTARQLPLPARPLPDPDDTEVIHTIDRRDGVIREETRVGREVFGAVIEYAFGTVDGASQWSAGTRTAVTTSHGSRIMTPRTGKAGIARRSTRLIPHAHGRPHFRGKQSVCGTAWRNASYCHLTNPRTGKDSIGPETADRAIGCERCHGPGGNHIVALEIGFPDLAIVNPAAPPLASRHEQAMQRLPYPSEEVPGQRAGKPRLGPLSGSRLGTQPLQ